MGYMTEHNLSARNIKDMNQFLELNDELKNREIIGYALEDGVYDKYGKTAEFNCFEPCKWYKHSEDMVMIAEKFPNIYFELEGNGESFGDFWREYYHDMDVERCNGEIVYEQPKKIQWNKLLRF